MAVAGISHGGEEVIRWGSFPVPFATLAVILRFVSRKLGKQLGSDDWCMLLALVLYCSNWIAHNLWAAVGKLGYAPSDLTSAEVDKTLKIFYFTNINYFLNCLAIQLSYLLLYRRIFVGKWINRAITFIGFLVILWAIAAVFIMIFQCSPVKSFFDSQIQPHSCIDLKIFYRVSGCQHIILDVIIYALPMPVIWRLTLPLRRKLGIISCFALGFIVCAASIIRLVPLWNVHPDNISSNSKMASIWTSIELGFGIACGCLPTLPRLYKRFVQRFFPRRVDIGRPSPDNLVILRNGSIIPRIPTQGDIVHDQDSKTSAVLHLSSLMRIIRYDHEHSYGREKDSGLDSATDAGEGASVTSRCASRDGAQRQAFDEKDISLQKIDESMTHGSHE